jgi:hypothetical protein
MSPLFHGETKLLYFLSICHQCVHPSVTNHVNVPHFNMACQIDLKLFRMVHCYCQDKRIQLFS